MPFTVRIKLLLKDFSVSQGLSRLHIIFNHSLLRHQGIVRLLKNNSLLFNWTLFETHLTHDLQSILA